ncbi:MAG TPA: hypothetical protein DCM27_03920 [Rhodospirillaceae bacterium]|nr:hypothetical protein [Rhodospirillaceae bacterium]
MSLSKSSVRQNGSALFMILIAVALFAALSYALSQQRDSGRALSSEKIKLLASDVIDMGQKMSETVAQMRLRNITLSKLSFENASVTGYTNPACTVDACKIFAYAGGGRDWETPAPDINNGVNWGYTGNLSVQNVGTSDADLIAILPNISLVICNQLNKMLGITGAPSVISAVVADQYIGNFSASPVNLTSASIDGKDAACVQLSAPSGTALVGPFTTPYAYYQVLSAR